MNGKMTKLALAVGTLLVACNTMAADSGTGSMAVSASIAAECAIGNSTPMMFGALTMLEAGAQSSASNSSSGGTFDAICTNGTSTPKLRFTSLNTASSKFRLVGVDGTSFIDYSLAESGGTAIVYGTDAAFTGLSGDGTTKNLAITGTIAAAAKNAKKSQAYSDTITITSSYTP